MLRRNSPVMKPWSQSWRRQRICDGKDLLKSYVGFEPGVKDGW